MKTVINTPALLLLALMVLLFGSCSSDDGTMEPGPKTGYVSAEAYLNEIGFRGSVLIQKEGTDILRKGFGMANAAQGIANEPELIYRIGSVTKSFTAAAIIHLMREGKIQNLDQTLDEFDTDFPFGDQISLKHLLTHNSGIPDYVGAARAYIDQQVDLDKDAIYELIAETTAEDGLQFTPGEYFSYSNANYFLLGLLIEELSGTTYPAYLQEKVYTPLAMENTAKGPDGISGNQRAQGYFEGQKVGAYPMHLAFSAGELESTLTDLEKWGHAMLGDYFSPAEKALVFAASSEQTGVNTAGAGWFSLPIQNQLVYHHGGDIDGFTSLLLLAPKHNGLIILLSNAQDQGEQRMQIMETLMANEF
ncbi:serine hydrolase domain-containing protein [Sediminicola luteus]|uniref:Serine hydrolase n=1 Tax=Sediminicola luteus TaxID=319238 RepID=A0A2A4GE89_9FLAO|nr:serine hydrolase domain-containing protein [Sediminicola luteus]PCE66318.1 serine hydrolase [Sediminicola luteus]